MARERGRLLLRQRKNEEALKELERGKSLRDNDPELMLLILEAHASGFNKIGAKKVERHGESLLKALGAEGAR